MLLTGMPVPLKAICMIAELLTVVALFQLLERRAPMFVALVAAVLAGKVVYYGLKALLLAPAVLIGTNVWLQLGTVAVYAALFATLRRRI